MIIDIREIPEGGLTVEGKTDQDIFQLNERNTRPDGPVSYQFQVELMSDAILVRGSVEAAFLVECVRCLDQVPLRIKLDECVLHLPLEGKDMIDLTEPLREDILLALPTYPHCEDATPRRDCSLAGKFEEPDDQGEHGEEDPPDQTDLWSGLDGFKPSP